MMSHKILPSKDFWMSKLWVKDCRSVFAFTTTAVVVVHGALPDQFVVSQVCFCLQSKEGEDKCISVELQVQMTGKVIDGLASKLLTVVTFGSQEEMGKGFTYVLLKNTKIMD